jgi:hypothetical protein
MYVFLEKLIHIVLPRIRDFHGLSPHSFDGRGNYSLGLREQTLSPKSSMTRSTASAAWTLHFAPPRAPTRKRSPCSKHWGLPFDPAKPNLSDLSNSNHVRRQME